LHGRINTTVVSAASMLYTVRVLLSQQMIDSGLRLLPHLDGIWVSFDFPVCESYLLLEICPYIARNH
jgi:hypothetical protein